MKKQENTTKVFILQEVGYTDLEGNFIKMDFPQQDFANALFKNAQSIDMDDFARALHKDGKAEINEQVKAELAALAPKLWVHRAASALTETISKL